MPQPRPFPHIYRHGSDNVNQPYYELRRTRTGIHYLNAYETLKRDLEILFEYIEPSERNKCAYSHRTFELLLRSCTEVESNIKCIARTNKKEWSKEQPDNILGYSDLEGPMRLSAYEVSCPISEIRAFRPFESFLATERKDRSPSWYKSYNQAKHDRVINFHYASLENVIHAMGGLYALLVAQYGSGFDTHLQYGGGMRVQHGLFVCRQGPKWNEEDSYSYNWRELMADPDPWAYHPIPIRP